MPSTYTHYLICYEKNDECHMLAASADQTFGISAIAVNNINPSKFQVRQALDGITPLCQSIETMGLLNPILVRQLDSGQFEVISGHRRLEACKALRWNEITCVVRRANDKEAYLLSLTENIERQTLSSIEEGEAFKRFVLEYGWGSVSELARRISRSEEYVSQKILILSLPPYILEKVRRGTLTESHAEELVWVKDPKLQANLSNAILKKHLSVSQTHAVARLLKQGMEIRESIAIVQPESNAVEFAKVIAQRKNKNDIRIKKVISTLRMSLSALDMVIGGYEETDDQSVRTKETLQKARYNLHQIIDDLVREKVALNRATKKKLSAS